MLPEVVEQKIVLAVSNASLTSATTRVTQANRTSDSSRILNRPKTLPIHQVNYTKEQKSSQQQQQKQRSNSVSEKHQQPKQQSILNTQRSSNGATVSPTKVLDHPLAHPLSSDGASSSGYSPTQPSLGPFAVSMIFGKGAQEMKAFSKQTNLNGKELDYCCELLTDQIEILQKNLAEEELKNNDAIFLSIAKLKIARDLLKGTLKLNEFE